MMDPSRLIYQLQNTGLQNKDNPLYQLLFQMIQIVTGLDKVTTGLSGSFGGGGSIINVIGFPPLALDNSEALLNEMLSVPGRDGIIGRDGAQGPPGYDGLDGESPDIIPGPIGPAGPMVPYYLGDNERFLVPLYKQALFSMNIELDGSAILEVDGYLIEVLDECCDIPPSPIFIGEGDNYSEENIFLLNDELVWHSVAFADLTFTANGGGTWAVDSADLVYYKWARKGNVVFIKGALLSTSVTPGATTTELRVSAPPGIVFAGNDSFGFTVYSETGFAGAGSSDTGQSIARVSTGLMTFKTRTGALWANTVNLTGIIWNLVVEI